jgi:hypothetical protein
VVGAAVVGALVGAVDEGAVVGAVVVSTVAGGWVLLGQTAVALSAVSSTLWSGALHPVLVPTTTATTAIRLSKPSNVKRRACGVVENAPGWGRGQGMHQ